MNGWALPLLGAGVTDAAAFACGLLALRALRIELRRVERYVLAFLLGSAVLSMLVLLLAAVHEARKGVFIVLAAAAVALAYHTRQGPGRESAMPLPRWLVALALAATLPFAVRYFVFAWAPEVSPDGST